MILKLLFQDRKPHSVALNAYICMHNEVTQIRSELYSEPSIKPGKGVMTHRIMAKQNIQASSFSWKHTN